METSAVELPTNIIDRRLVRPDRRTVAWTETGTLDGRPVLRLPGTPGSRLWLRADQTPWVERGLRIITTERPGFGASSRLPGRGFAQPADDLAAILDELGIDRLPTYGSSGGAPHILAFAARHPDRVAAASVVAGVAPIDDGEVEQLIGVNAEGFRLAMAGDIAGMRRLLAPLREALLADPLASFRDVMHTAPPLDQQIMRDAAWQATLELGIREALRPDVDGWVDESMLMLSDWPEIDLQAVQASVTWWHGERDRNAPLSAVRRVVAQLPNARLVVWPGAGHLNAYRLEGEILDELLARS